MQKDKIILIGIGNTLRSDDGVGPYVIEKIEASGAYSCTFLILPQLSADIISYLISFENILIVDAGVGINTVRWMNITDQYNGTAPSAHHMDPAQLVSLAQSLFSVTLSLAVCTIPVYDLSIGEELSVQTRAFANEAILQIGEWISSINA